MPRPAPRVLVLTAAALLACGRGGKNLPRAEADRPTAPTSEGSQGQGAAGELAELAAIDTRGAAGALTEAPKASPERPEGGPLVGPEGLHPEASADPSGPSIDPAQDPSTETPATPKEGTETPAVPLWGVDDGGSLTPLPSPTANGADDPVNDDDDDVKRQVWVTHTVRPRETIELLALRYRSDPGKIRGWNKLPPGAKAKKRSKLRILARRNPPPREYVRHVVTEGETWGRVGHRYGVDPSDLRGINMHRVRRTLDPGEELDVWYDPTILAAIEGDAPSPGPAAAVSPGAYAVGRPHEGRLVNGTRIPESDAYELRYPGSSWGTTNSVRALVIGIHAWRESSGYSGRLAIGAMSRERGRPIGGHLSHQCGRDVDIRLPLYERLRQSLTPLGRRVDWWALWQLIVALEETGQVYRIFLDYKMQKRLYKAAKEHGVDKETRRRVIQFPRGRGSGRGLVRHSPGHDRHFHARFRCADFEVECLDA